MSDDYDALAQEAADLANGLEALFAGRRTAAALWAISLVLGGIAVNLDDPDIDKLLDVVTQGTRDAFASKLKERAH